ncbi:hypothetical protein ANN_01175 [Periplaneta americana]|uniref:Uncharacterized protein n=1 Tax=Periplaneta americana TaxID=6978 RepID=A0ABQ8TSU3_PERAM|nr:hypothetical protein ANN_01175 [Periplaneta americana]
MHSNCCTITVIRSLARVHFVFSYGSRSYTYSLALDENSDIAQSAWILSVTGYNKKNKKSIKYPNLQSAFRPVTHGPDLLVPTPPANMSDSEYESNSPNAAAEEMCSTPEEFDNSQKKFYPTQDE